jgi:hypothetical protein
MKPQKEINGLTFYPIPEFPEFYGVLLIYGNAIPKYFNIHELPEIPKEYKDMAQTFFITCRKIPVFHPKINREKAIRALWIWLSDFTRPYEVKIATVGYALWLWTDPTALNE